MLFGMLVTISPFIPVWFSMPDPTRKVFVVALSYLDFPGALINMLLPVGSFLANVGFWFVVGFLVLQRRARRVASVETD